MSSKPWNHSLGDCDRGVEGLTEECDTFREGVRYEAVSHSCRRCGISQKLCVTGEDVKAKCQWPSVLVIVLRGDMVAEGGMALFQGVGFARDREEWDEHARWLGQRHARRIWAEVISNVMAVLVETIRRRRKEGRVGTDVECGRSSKGGKGCASSAVLGEARRHGDTSGEIADGTGSHES